MDFTPTLTGIILDEARKELQKEIQNDPEPFYKYVTPNMFTDGDMPKLIDQSYGYGKKYNHFDLMPKLMKDGYSAGAPFRNMVIQNYLADGHAAKYIERFYNFVAEGSRELPKLKEEVKDLRNRLSVAKNNIADRENQMKELVELLGQQILSISDVEEISKVVVDFHDAPHGSKIGKCPQCGKFKYLTIPVYADDPEGLKVCSQGCVGMNWNE